MFITTWKNRCFVTEVILLSFLSDGNIPQNPERALEGKFWCLNEILINVLNTLKIK